HERDGRGRRVSRVVHVTVVVMAGVGGCMAFPVFEKDFEKSFRWIPKRIAAGMGWQTDTYRFSGEADITLHAGSSLTVLEQFGIDQALSSGNAYVGIPASRAAIDVSYLCLIPAVSHIRYRLHVTLAKPTNANGGSTLEPLAAQSDARMIVFN